MAKSFRDKRRNEYHRACKAGVEAVVAIPYEERLRVTGTLDHNWKQTVKHEARKDQRAESRRIVTEELG